MYSWLIMIHNEQSFSLQLYPAMVLVPSFLTDFPNGSEKAFVYVSRTLITTEQNYRQIKEEVLVSVFQCSMFNVVWQAKTSCGASDGPASRGRIGLEGTVAIPKELKWTVKGLPSRVKLSGIASQLLAVGTIRRQSNQSRWKGEGKGDEEWESEGKQHQIKCKEQMKTEKRIWKKGH